MKHCLRDGCIEVFIPQEDMYDERVWLLCILPTPNDLSSYDHYDIMFSRLEK